MHIFSWFRTSMQRSHKPKAIRLRPPLSVLLLRKLALISLRLGNAWYGAIETMLWRDVMRSSKQLNEMQKARLLKKTDAGM